MTVMVSGEIMRQCCVLWYVCIKEILVSCNTVKKFGLKIRKFTYMHL